MLRSLSEQLQNKSLTPSAHLESCLSKINEKDKEIRAFLETEAEEARIAAQESDNRHISGKTLSAYDGIVIGIKDNIVTKDRKTTCASKILAGYRSPFSATVIERLQALGFITIGRLNMDEFAMGSSTENSAYQITRNPWDKERAPGGSSGGSAAAVAAGMVPVSLGSDTGGSIRQPAAFCGLTGLKPTYGTVSRYGLVAFASSLDQIGPLARSVDDIEIIHNIIRGHDPKDSTTVPDSWYNKAPARAASGSLERIRIGIPRALVEDCAAEVRDSLEKSAEYFSESLKAAIIDIDLPNQKYGIPVYYLTATSEASANLARFDGVRYGHRSSAAGNLEELYTLSRTEGFGPEVKRRILLGTYALSSGYYDAFYGQAQRVRSLIRNDYLRAFAEADLILMPATPSPAFKIGEKTDDPVQMYLSDVLTVGASLAGIPALSVPGPTTGLPVGLQLQGPFFSENLLFAAGKHLEKFYRQPDCP